MGPHNNPYRRHSTRENTNSRMTPLQKYTSSTHGNLAPCRHHSSCRGIFQHTWGHTIIRTGVIQHVKTPIAECRPSKNTHHPRMAIWPHAGIIHPVGAFFSTHEAHNNPSGTGVLQQGKTLTA